jgi:hypothetical protein
MSRGFANVCSQTKHSSNEKATKNSLKKYPKRIVVILFEILSEIISPLTRKNGVYYLILGRPLKTSKPVAIHLQIKVNANP